MFLPKQRLDYVFQQAQKPPLDAKALSDNLGKAQEAGMRPDLDYEAVMAEKFRKDLTPHRVVSIRRANTAYSTMRSNLQLNDGVAYHCVARRREKRPSRYAILH